MLFPSYPLSFWAPSSQEVIDNQPKEVMMDSDADSIIIYKKMTVKSAEVKCFIRL